MRLVHTAQDVCRASGLTYRQVDHWVTTGVLVPIDTPNPGSGAGRRFSSEEMTVACVLASMRTLAVPLGVLDRVAQQLRMFGADDWRGLLFVDADGWVQRTPHVAHAGWILDLDRFIDAYA